MYMVDILSYNDDIPVQYEIIESYCSAIICHIAAMLVVVKVTKPRLARLTSHILLFYAELS